MSTFSVKDNQKLVANNRTLGYSIRVKGILLLTPFTTNNMTTKKVTLATIKSFIKREIAKDNLYIKSLSDFDGMVDCVMPVKSDFTKVVIDEKLSDNTLGIKGAWFVGQSRDYFTPFANDDFIGYEVYNCCGSFLLAFHR